MSEKILKIKREPPYGFMDPLSKKEFESVRIVGLETEIKIQAFADAIRIFEKGKQIKEIKLAPE